jgi:transposase
VQDEAELSLFPTLTRTWMPRGRQRKVRAPGVHPPKRNECAATDWRTGAVVRVRSERRSAAAFCELLEQCVARSAGRKRRVILVTDQFKIHKAEGSKQLRALLAHYGRRVTLRYLPSYSPECMPMERLWNDWRDNVTHNHDRARIQELEGDSDHYFARRSRDPRAVLKTLGSPFAQRRQKRRY